MIELHRLSTSREPVVVNPDLILTVESTPDTHVRFATGATMLVAETSDEVIEAVRAWRVGIASRSLVVRS